MSDSALVFPFIELIEHEAAAISAEALALDEALFLAMPESDVYRGQWRIFPLFLGSIAEEIQGVDLDANRARCPQTARVLDRVEGLLLAGFTWLAPGAELAPHRDPRDDNAIRGHLGIVLPPSEQSFWPVGTLRLHDVRVLHGVKNDSDKPRITLLVDVKMPFAIPEGAIAPRPTTS